MTCSSRRHASPSSRRRTACTPSRRSWSRPWLTSDGHLHTVGAGLPAMQAIRCMAPAPPVIAGKPAPTRNEIRPLSPKGHSPCVSLLHWAATPCCVAASP
ncbi:hypothetical protein ELF58_25645 [Salmonella enterica]|nr:hypothetical protein [Salmonella enterica]